MLGHGQAVVGSAAAMRRCRLSSPKLTRKAFCGDWMEPKSRMSWAVAFVMNAPSRPKRSVYTTPW